MSNLNFTITLNAPVEKVWMLMLNHPTYEIRSKAFAENSTYEGTRVQGTDMRFGDGSGVSDMIATVAVNTTHEFLSLKHLGHMSADNEIQEHKTESYENYRFTKIDENTTRVDIELIGLPEERQPMFKEMRPNALELLKGLCE